MKVTKNMIKFNRKNKQKGVTLAIGLMLLLIIAVIGVTSMKSALMQEKMAGAMIKHDFVEAGVNSMLVSAESYVFELYANNNGTEDVACVFCLKTSSGGAIQPTDPLYQGFISQKNMLSGGTYPGFNSSELLPVKDGAYGQLADLPRFMISKITNNIDGTIDPEFDGGSAGANSGSSGVQKQESKFDFFTIAAKANDLDRNYYVVLQSVFAVVIN